MTRRQGDTAVPLSWGPNVGQPTATRRWSRVVPAWFRLPKGPARSVVLGVLVAALIAPGLWAVEQLLRDDEAPPRVDSVLLQFFGPELVLQDRGSFRVQDVALATSSAEPFGSFLRVTYPRGSASPTAARSDGSALGGAQFYLDTRSRLRGETHLRYFMRIPEDFDFVRGGKLPGLYGGTATASGVASEPDAQGISTRLGWAPEGQGEIYAYASSLGPQPLSLGRGAWSWPTGRWVCVEQAVRLNGPDARDGQIRLWVDDDLVWQQNGLALRGRESLQLEGLFFSTFFGGSDASWATPRTQWIDFAGFELGDSPVGCSPR